MQRSWIGDAWPLQSLHKKLKKQTNSQTTTIKEKRLADIELKYKRRAAGYASVTEVVVKYNTGAENILKNLLKFLLLWGNCWGHLFKNLK